MDKTEREKTIIEAAQKVFSREGFSETRMADIAREANLSYGLIYHYFGNKESLFEVIIEQWWNEYYAKLEQLKSSSLSTCDKLTGIIKFLLNVYETRPHLLTIFISEVSRGFVYQKKTRRKDRFTKLFSLCEAIIVEGQDNNIIRKDIQANYLAIIFLGSLDSVLSVMILGNEPLNKQREKRIIESLTKIFFQGASLRQEGVSP